MIQILGQYRLNQKILCLDAAYFIVHCESNKENRSGKKTLGKHCETQIVTLSGSSNCKHACFEILATPAINTFAYIYQYTPSNST